MDEEQNVLIESINKFSMEFYKQIASDSPNKNLVMSPLSVEIILALIYLGANGKTKQELETALHFPDENYVRSAMKVNLQDLNSTEGVNLKIANKIFVKDGESYVLAPEFKKYAVENFLSDAENIDFDDRVFATEKINSWVRDRTNDKIKEFISSDSLNSDTRLVLVNAIYFKGNWKNTFDVEETNKDEFYITKENKIMVDMMNQTGRFPYVRLSDWDAKAVKMAYVNDHTSMVFILPNEIEGIGKVEEKICLGINMDEILNSLKKVRVMISLPKFKIETSMDLTCVLTKLGVQRIFDQEKAELNNITEKNSKLFVSSATQKAFIEVNEEGTEAAAAVDFRMMLKRRHNIKNFVADRPFFYVLLNKSQILFVGKVMNPLLNN